MKTIKLHTPKGWRMGQTIFNFLEWLAAHKGYDAGQNKRMADPFYIFDSDFERLYKEFLKEMK